ncbi:MAG: hypothetical protein GX461_04740, partial [Clostridiales bacterium]|nr:hypothetical protein [Clostridiales bacterium]
MKNSRSRKRILSYIVIISMIVMMIPTVAAGAEEATYHVADIEVINNIIDDNGLDWEKAPEDGSSVPSDWDDYVEWSEGPSNRRITQLSLWQLGLSGTLDVSGLSDLEWLSCSENNLSELDLSGLSYLQT